MPSALPSPRPSHALFASALLIAACADTGGQRNLRVDDPQPSSTAGSHRPSAAAGKRLSIDALYDAPDKRVDFNGNPPANLAWIDDEHYLSPKTDSKSKTTPAEWLLVEADSGKAEPFTLAAEVEAALAGLPEIGAAKARKLVEARKADAFAGSPKALLFTVRREGKKEDSEDAGSHPSGGDLYLYFVADRKASRLTNSPEEAQCAELSPDGKFVAFVRDHDLYVEDVATGAARRITPDGGPTTLNGELDWLYQEEVFGRGTWRAFWWSPDSSCIAYLHLDEAGVPSYTLVDDVASPIDVDASPYPRPGDPNPTVKLGVVRLSAEHTEWVDLAKYAGGEILVVDVSWSPSGDLAFEVQDREQKVLDLDVVKSAQTPGRTPGAQLEPRTLLNESTKAWVNVHGSPKWLGDGSFLWFSERTGWKHLYHYDATGKLLASVTSGAWEARELRGVDEKGGWVYFTGTERSPIGADEYRVKLDGTGLARLTKPGGTHGATFNPSFTRFLDRWGDASTPTQVRLDRADGTEVRTIDANPVPALAEYSFSKPEFLKVKTRDGFEMEAMLIKPPDFDPKKRYPVLQSTYGGPHAPQVHDAWPGTRGMFLQLVAQSGVVVWVCDNRSASGKGAQSEWTCFQNLGEGELADIEDGIAWLKSQPWVDPERIGITGWSYGGFMTSYALTHSKSFAMGIAGGSVTDWHNYDSIYTERYMHTPDHNKQGYERTSVVAAAKDLHGELLLIHGAIDDNVHSQNTMQLAYALQKAGKPFRMMLYPKSRHGVRDPALVKHLQASMLAFIEETLLGKDKVGARAVP